MPRSTALTIGLPTLVPGTYRPGASTTGAPTLTPATTISGSKSLTVAGEVYNDTLFTGVVTSHLGSPSLVTTFNRCVFIGPVTAPVSHTGLVRTFASDTGSVVLNDCTLVPQTPGQYWMGMQGAYMTLRRCDIYNVVDGIEIWDSNEPSGSSFDAATLLEANWIHDLSYFSPSADADNKTHNDCVQVEGGGNIEMVGNFFDSYLAPLPVGDDPGTVPRPSGVGPGDQANAALMIKPDVNIIDDLNIHHNWLFGGGYTVNIAHDSPRFLGDIGNISDNRFDRYPHAGKQMSMPGAGSSGSPPIVTGTFDRNVFDDDDTAITVWHNG